MKTIKSKNHPDFCAKYVRHVGTAKCIVVGWTNVYQLNDKYFIRWDSSAPVLKVGQKVWVAKKVKLPNDQWEVHEVELPECYWGYSLYMKRSVEQQRMMKYEPQVGMGRNWGDRVILQPVSENYVRRLMKQYA